jgi:tetratricopeptide (TPR) repeat protein
MDHAAMAARAALKTFRNYPEDPRLPGILVTLGNALRKSVPGEAEALYREAAERHAAKGRLESASVAWGNLGVLCSEQGRHAESLRFYEKALQVREQSPATPAVQIGTLLNNIASCLRRTGNFEEAHMRLDQSIEMFRLDKLNGPSWLTYAYGTRGQIFKDQGRDEEALTWLRRSYTERMKTASPNLDSVAEILEDEIAVLTRSGRPEEASQAQERLASVHAAKKEIPGPVRDLNALISRARGTVSIEIRSGSRRGSDDCRQDLARLALDLKLAVESQNAGVFGKFITIPESTTALFYGEDGEALFQAMLPVLVGKGTIDGAIVTVRQGETSRVMVLPARII